MKLTEKQINKANTLAGKVNEDTNGLDDLLKNALGNPTDKKAVKAAQKALDKISAGFAKVLAVLEPTK